MHADTFEPLDDPTSMGSWTMVNELATLMSIQITPGRFSNVAYLLSNGGWEDVHNSKTSIPGMNLSCSMDSEYSRLIHHHVGSAVADERIFWGGGCTGNSVQEGRLNSL